jgi:hypothetical protein
VTTPRNAAEVRARAWATRRAKYGPTGHRAVYSRPPGQCPACDRMRAYLTRLYVEGTLSEGQAAKATGLDRVSLRKLADDQVPA